MLQKKSRILSAVLLIFCLSVWTQAQVTQTTKPVLLIQDFENRGRGFDIIGDVMKFSLKTVLTLTGKYRIITQETLDQYLEEVGALDLREQLRTRDDILLHRGRLLITEVMRGSYMPILNGQQVLWEVHVYRLTDGEDSFLQAYQSTTDAEIFDVIDGIGQDLSRILTGKTLAVARVDVSTMVPGSIIWIDGIAAGTNSVQYKRAIAGLPHEVKITDQEGVVLFTKTVVPEEGLIYDINYNFKEYEKLVEREVYLPSTNVIDQTNLVLLYRTNQLQVISTNWITEKISRQTASADNVLPRFKKFGWSMSGGGGTMGSVGLYYAFDGLLLELDAGFIPLFLGYTTDNYLSARISVSIFPFQQNSMFSPYVRMGIMSYYGLSLGLIPTLAHPYDAIGLQMRFRKLPGFLGTMRIYAEFSHLGYGFAPNTMNISGSLFDKPMLTFGVRF